MLVLFNQSGFKAARSFSWSIQFKLAIFRLQGLAGRAVAAITRFGLFMFGKARMIYRFNVECCIDRDFWQHLPKLVEIFFSFDVISDRLGYRLELFFVDHLPILGLMIGSYTEFRIVSSRAVGLTGFYISRHP